MRGGPLPFSLWCKLPNARLQNASMVKAFLLASVLQAASSSVSRGKIDAASIHSRAPSTNQWCISAQGFVTYRLRTHSRRHTQRACTSREQPWRAAEAEDAAEDAAEAGAGAAGPA